MLLKPEEVIEYVNGLANEAAFTRRDNEYDEKRKWLFGEHAFDTGVKTQVKFRPYNLADDAHAFKNRMLAAPVKVQTTATRETEASQKKAQNQENFYRRHYYHWRDEGKFDPILFDMASLGMGAGYLKFNAEALPIIPEYDGKNADRYLEEGEKAIKAFIEKEQGDLFEFDPIDPITLQWNPDESILTAKQLIPFYSLQKEYAKKGTYIDKSATGYTVTTLTPGEHPSSSPRLWSEMCEVYTMETEDYCYHVLLDPAKSGQKGHVLGVYRNYFGRPAFVYTYGEKTGSQDPAKKYLSLIEGKYTIVPHLSRMTTALLNAGLDAAQMRYALEPTGDQTFDPDGAPTIDVTEEGFLMPPPGYKIVAPRLELGVDVEKAIQLLQALDTFGYPKSLNRPEEVQANSGYDRARQQDAVASLLKPPLDHYGSMLTRVFSMMAHAVKEIDLPIAVRNIYMPDGRKRVGETITIHPNDVIDADISVSFNSITLFNQIALQEEGLKLMQADQMTETQFQSDIMGYDDPEAFRMQRDEDKVRRAAGDRAVQDVLMAIDALRGVTLDEAMAEEAISPMVQTNEDQLRSDRGPSMPLGPGAAMPLQPTPPMQAEMGVPV